LGLSLAELFRLRSISRRTPPNGAVAGAVDSAPLLPPCVALSGVANRHVLRKAGSEVRTRAWLAQRRPFASAVPNEDGAASQETAGREEGQLIGGDIEQCWGQLRRLEPEQQPDPGGGSDDRAEGEQDWAEPISAH
jgi:hypothetical protein